jgi:hypothetical protein
MRSFHHHLCAVFLLCHSIAAGAERRDVSDPASLNSAIASAVAGDTILVDAGTYSDWDVKCATSGTPSAPITLAAADGWLLRPAKTSPARNAGKDLRDAPWSIAGDVDGDSRNSATPDIGCDEVSAAKPAFSPLRFVDVGPSYLNGNPWGDPHPES